MRKQVIFIFITSFSFNLIFSQTKLDQKIDYLRKKQEVQDKKIAEVKITSVMFERLENMAIDTSKIDFTNFQDRKQIVVLFQIEKKHYRQLATGIGLNLIGTALMGLGGNLIYTDINNSRGGLEGILGVSAITMGTIINLNSIPLYINSKKNLNHYRDLKQKLINEKGF